MFISTPEDKHHSQITRHQPTAPILNRVALLAQESVTVLESQLESTRIGLDFKVRLNNEVNGINSMVQSGFAMTGGCR